MQNFYSLFAVISNVHARHLVQQKPRIPRLWAFFFWYKRRPKNLNRLPIIFFLAFSYRLFSFFGTRDARKTWERASSYFFSYFSLSFFLSFRLQQFTNSRHALFGAVWHSLLHRHEQVDKRKSSVNLMIICIWKLTEGLTRERFVWSQTFDSRPKHINVYSCVYICVYICTRSSYI